VFEAEWAVTAHWLMGKAAAYVLAPFQSQDAFLEAVSGAVTAVTSLKSKTGWLYLLTAVLIAVPVYRFERRKALVRATSFFRFLFPREIYLHRSAIVDYKYVALDRTIKMIVYTPLITGLSVLVYKASVAVFAWLPALGLSPAAVLAGTIAVPILVVVIGDLGFFLSHYLMHRIPVLWCFHEVHHSAEVLTPVTVYRMHPVEELVTNMVAGFLAGIGAAVYTSATKNQVSLPTMLGVNVVQFLFFSVAFQLRHTHVWLSYGRYLSWIFISPAQHQIHHSTDPKHWDKNYGFIFAVWDAMLGSLYVPKAREMLRFGVPNANPDDFSSVARLYFLPFAKAARRMGRAAPQGSNLGGAVSRQGS
jgi:sterol desaturase/sphingolipid hydroxylase (fatty acid hydroxylase superfamily)